MNQKDNMIARHPIFKTAPFGDISQFFKTALDGLDRLNEPTLSDHQLYSTESGWILRIDAPEVSKEDIEISFENQGLEVSSKVGEFELEKRFVLGNDVDIENISAKLEDGILELKLPKTQTKKTINIQ